MTARSGTKYDRLKEQALAALLENARLQDAAAAIGVSAPTPRRWLKVPEFQQAYRRARRQILRAALRRQGVTSHG